MSSETIDQERDQILSFINIIDGEVTEVATRFLEATRWNLQDAVNLFLMARRLQHHQELEIPNVVPSVYDADICYTCPFAISTEEIWDATQEDEEPYGSSLYCPPPDLFFSGSFEEAKAASCRKDMWLLVYDDTYEGQKISTFYGNIFVPPVILLIDPITGQKMHTWAGMIEAQAFLQELMTYLDVGPHEHVASLTSNKRIKTEPIWFSSSQAYNGGDQDMSTFADPPLPDSIEETLMSLTELDEEARLLSDLFEFPALTEEPKEDCDPSLLCSLCVRFPDGRRKQRKFLKSEPVQLLWSFCFSLMEESEEKAFKLVQAIPGATKTLDYGAEATFGQSGIANSMVSVTW
ncbi:hypothetical protein CARUB_v10007353mg, partial [Capsella rubella]